MRKTFDSLPLLAQLGPFWKTHFQSREELKVVWEAMVRLSDDLLLNAAYTNQSKSVATVASRLVKPLLYRKLDQWTDTGANHAHRKMSFDGSGLTTVYTGAYFDPATADVFLNGGQLDDPGSSTDYRLLNTPDAAQVLGTEPLGTRIEFDYTLAAGTRVDVYGEAMIESVRAVSDGTTTEVLFDHDVEPLSARVVVESVAITNSVTLDIGLTTTTVSWTAGRQFYAGTVVRVVDTVNTAVYDVTITEDTDSFELAAVLDPSATVEVVVEVPLSAVSVADEQLLVADTTVTPEVEFVVSDSMGGYGFKTDTLGAVFQLPRSFDEDSLSILFQGAEVTDPFTATADSITLTRPFFSGTRYRVEARTVVSHSHAHERVTTSGVVTTVPLPGGAEPFEFVGLDQDGDYPIHVFLNDAYVHEDEYSITSPTAVEFNTPLPDGSVVDVYYAIDTQVSHLHRRARTVTINNQNVFEIGHTQDAQPYRAIADSGANVAADDATVYLVGGTQVVIAPGVLPDNVIRTRTTEFRYAYEHALAVDPDAGIDDTRITQADTLQNGIDERDDISPGGWTTQLVWDDGFTISNGLIASTTVIEDAWFENAQINLETGYDNFGRLIDFHRDNTVDYLNRLQVLFSSYQAAATARNIENTSCVVLGSQFTQQPAVVQTVTGTGDDREVTVRNADESTEVLALHPSIPDRLPAGDLPRFHAVSEHARLFTPSVDAFPLMPIVAEQFSRDFAFGKMMDRFEAAELDRSFSPDIPFDVDNRAFEDFGVDFIEEGAQAGDFIFVYVGATPISAKVERVEQHRLVLGQLTPPAATGYSLGGYSEGGYSGITLVDEITRYVLFLRKRRRKDSLYFLDEAPEEDRQAAAEAVVPLFTAFVRLLQIRWEAMREQEQDDLGVYLERVRPATSKIVAFSKAFNEDGLVDPLSVTTSEAVTMVDTLDYYYAGLTSISGSDPAAVGDGFAGGFLG